MAASKSEGIKASCGKADIFPFLFFFFAMLSQRPPSLVPHRMASPLNQSPGVLFRKIFTLGAQLLKVTFCLSICWEFANIICNKRAGCPSTSASEQDNEAEGSDH